MLKQEDIKPGVLIRLVHTGDISPYIDLNLIERNKIPIKKKNICLILSSLKEPEGCFEVLHNGRICFILECWKFCFEAVHF